MPKTGFEPHISVLETTAWPTEPQPLARCNKRLFVSLFKASVQPRFRFFSYILSTTQSQLNHNNNKTKTPTFRFKIHAFNIQVANPGADLINKF